MDEIAKSITDIVTKDMPTSGLGGTKPISSSTLLRTSTARERIGGCITELEALVTDLNTLIKTLGSIRERL
jgi:hypothetical protein